MRSVLSASMSSGVSPKILHKARSRRCTVISCKIGRSEIEFFPPSVFNDTDNSQTLRCSVVFSSFAFLLSVLSHIMKPN